MNRAERAAPISAVDKEAVLKRQQQREAEARREADSRGVHDVERQLYNAVPQRGRRLAQDGEPD